MKPGDDLTEKFYVSRRSGNLTPLLLDEKKRPVRFAGHSSDSSTASNWARGTVSKVEDIASRTLMKVSHLNPAQHHSQPFQPHTAASSNNNHLKVLS